MRMLINSARRRVGPVDSLLKHTLLISGRTVLELGLPWRHATGFFTQIGFWHIKSREFTK